MTEVLRKAELVARHKSGNQFGLDSRHENLAQSTYSFLTSSSFGCILSSKTRRARHPTDSREPRANASFLTSIALSQSIVPSTDWLPSTPWQHRRPARSVKERHEHQSWDPSPSKCNLSGFTDSRRIRTISQQGITWCSVFI